MICPKCKGERAVYRKVGNIITLVPCPICNGTGEFNPNDTERFNGVDLIKLMEMIKGPKTNFDRITESPEKLAEWLDEHSDYCREIQNWQCDKCPYCDKDCTRENTWLDWLNEECKE
jgi:hypothetical protein